MSQDVSLPDFIVALIRQYKELAPSRALPTSRDAMRIHANKLWREWKLQGNTTSKAIAETCYAILTLGDIDFTRVVREFPRMVFGSVVSADNVTKIYAFTTSLPEYAGYLKIGETKRNVFHRIKEQIRPRENADIVFVNEIHNTPQRNIDTLIHHELDRHGCVRHTADREWVKCTVRELERAFIAIRLQFEK
jgi:hypothetical protein